MCEIFGSLLCDVATLVLNVVTFQRRDVKLTPLCHVATWISNVATWIFFTLCHVATWLPTSRRQIVPFLSRCDVDFQRRDVDFNEPLERRDVNSRRHDIGFSTLYNVATLPRTSRRCPILSPRTVHSLLFISHTPLPETLAFLRTCPHRTCKSPLSHWSEASTPFSDHHCAPTSHHLHLVPGHCGISTTLCSVLAWV